MMSDVITPAERRMIDRAVAAGDVWEVPRGAYTEAAPGGWRGAASGRVLVLPDGANEESIPDQWRTPEKKSGRRGSRRRGPTERTKWMIEKIKVMADEGLYAAQIAARLKISSGHLSNVAKRYGLKMPAGPRRKHAA